MQSLTGFARKYAIMEELDGGFGTGSTPEAFVRLDTWEGRIQASLHAKGLKQGPFVYKLYLIFAKNEMLVPLLAGSMSTSYSGMQTGLEIDAETMKSNDIKPEMVRFAAVTAESQDKKWVPLFSSFEKNYKWDESIRQILLKKPVVEESPEVKNVAEEHVSIEEKKAVPQPVVSNKTEETRPEPVVARITPQNIPQRQAIQDNNIGRCDINKLEGFLQNNFEGYLPFKRASRGYSWYRVSDLAKLSNIMYMSGINVPVFANPKILVGLFKFKHILAGLYRGDNGANYYVIGVPAKDENDNKPFENACRWVAVSESPARDMGGYWLVYVSLKSGEIVV
jgi:hypothetical protein